MFINKTTVLVLKTKHFTIIQRKPYLRFPIQISGVRDSNFITRTTQYFVSHEIYMINITTTVLQPKIGNKKLFKKFQKHGLEGTH